MLSNRTSIALAALLSCANAIRSCTLPAAIVLSLAVTMAPSSASETGHVTGVGGIVVASKHPRALADWYRDMLGIDMKSWGGAMFLANAPGHPPYTLWSALPTASKEFDHSQRGAMLVLSVDDLEALCRHLKAEGVDIYDRQSSTYGNFASVVDPDGMKIELWQAPKAK